MAKKNKTNGYNGTKNATTKIILICVICALIGGVALGATGVLIYRELSASESGHTSGTSGKDAGDNLADGEIFDYEEAG